MNRPHDKLNEVSVFAAAAIGECLGGEFWTVGKELKPGEDAEFEIRQLHVAEPMTFKLSMSDEDVDRYFSS